jgi:hypothetical protein
MRTTRIDRPPAVLNMTTPREPLPDLRDLPPLTAAESQEAERAFLASAERESSRLLALLRRDGLNATALRPEWMLSFAWMDELVTPNLTAPLDAPPTLESAEPLHARSIVLRLALPGGEEHDGVTVRLETRVYITRYPHGARYAELLAGVGLTVRAGGRTYIGRVEEGRTEMQTAAVGLRGAPQEVLEQTVAALSRPDVGDWPASLYAALAPTGRCHACARPLTDAISKVLGLGPDCAARIGLEHSQRMADAVLTRRAAQ